jgi:hypothetical protein
MKQKKVKDPITSYLKFQIIIVGEKIISKKKPNF